MKEFTIEDIDCLLHCIGADRSEYDYERQDPKEHEEWLKHVARRSGLESRLKRMKKAKLKAMQRA